MLAHLVEKYTATLQVWMHNIKKLLDEVEYDIINHQSRGLSYLLKLKAGADNTDIRFDNS